MNLPLAAALAAVLILTGIGVAIYAWIPQPVRPRPIRHKLRAPAAIARLTTRTRRLLLLGAGVGTVVAVVTGWVAGIAIIPAALVGIPHLLGSGDEDRQIHRLEALEEWTRSLAGLLGGGATSLEQAIRSTLRSTNEAIRPEVSDLVARINGRDRIVPALQAFADDINDITGDKIAAALILSAQKRGAGIAKTLEGLASSVADEVTGRRAIAAARQAPRTTARWVTIITLLLVGGIALTGSYAEPYATPLGQLILITLISLYVALLFWLKAMTRSKPTPRFLTGGAPR